MSKLSPTQATILKAAAKKQQADIREFMGDLKSPAIRDKVLQSMLKNDLVEEADQDGGVAYVISAAGLEAVGGKKAKTPVAKPASKAKAKAKAEADEPKVSKQQIIIDMLKRKGGATLVQMMEATGWQKHSLHGAMAGSLKKKLGLTITSSKKEGEDRVYKIA